TRQAHAAADLPAMREAEAKADAALQRLTAARETLEREEPRAKDRMAELDRRLVQLDADIQRERRRAADAEPALARLAGEEDTLQRETSANEAQRAGVDQRVAEADAVLATSEKAADELTGTLPDLAARRHALEQAAREHGDRIGRLADEIAAGAAELAQIEGAQRADLPTLAGAAETSGAAVAEGEGAPPRPHTTGPRSVRPQRPRCAPGPHIPQAARLWTSRAARSPRRSAWRNV